MTEVSKWTEDIAVAKQRIRYTEEGELYKTERWSKKNFGYKIPLGKDGEYVVITQHSEVR